MRYSKRCFQESSGKHMLAVIRAGCKACSDNKMEPADSAAGDIAVLIIQQFLREINYNSVSIQIQVTQSPPLHVYINVIHSGVALIHENPYVLTGHERSLVRVE